MKEKKYMDEIAGGLLKEKILKGTGVIFYFAIICFIFIVTASVILLGYKFYEITYKNKSGVGGIALYEAENNNKLQGNSAYELLTYKLIIDKEEVIDENQFNLFFSTISGKLKKTKESGELVISGLFKRKDAEDLIKKLEHHKIIKPGSIKIQEPAIK